MKDGGFYTLIEQFVNGFAIRIICASKKHQTKKSCTSRNFPQSARYQIFAVSPGLRCGNFAVICQFLNGSIGIFLKIFHHSIALLLPSLPRWPRRTLTKIAEIAYLLGRSLHSFFNLPPFKDREFYRSLLFPYIRVNTEK